MDNDGGPAFPHFDGLRSDFNGGYFAKNVGGMTLRDYFAAAALTGLVSSPEGLVGMREVGKGYGMQVAEYAASVAYEMADAMLAARGGHGADS